MSTLSTTHARQGLTLDAFLVTLLAGLLVGLASRAAWTAVPVTFPLVIKRTTLNISPVLDRKTLVEQMRSALADEKPTISTADRLQYDYIAVKGQGPVAVLADFDDKGGWVAISIDSSMKQQNPVARDLVAWLKKHVGPGRKAGKDRVWMYGGMRFKLYEVRDAGDDSTYGVTITRKRIP